MSDEAMTFGQKTVIGFFAVCCALALTNVIRFAVSGTKVGILFALAQCVFILFAGSAAWYLYQSKKAGWYLSALVVLNWFSALVNLKLAWGIFTAAFSAGMFAVLLWLLRSSVRARFGVKFGLS
jgi:hypothetical protein